MLTQRLSNRRLLVDFLALMFGLGAWIGVNGIYVQLPLIVHTAPEEWSLPAHMVMLVQFANLGPILYTLYIKYTAWAHDRYIIYALLGAGTCSCIALSWLYNHTSIVFGREHSTALLALMFVTALVGCTSSVLFMPYMRNYRIVLYLAAKSPHPPLEHSWIGELMVVVLWITLCGLMGFVKMGITTFYRPDPGRGLYYTGVATQIGSLIGAITTFCLVNYANVFQSYSPCAYLMED